MKQRDDNYTDLTGATEEKHRDSFYFCLLRNPDLSPRVEFKVVKVIRYLLLASRYLTSSVAKPNKRPNRSSHRGLWTADRY